MGEGGNTGSLMAGLYLHIPFCEQKCIYCDFYSIAPDKEPSDYEGLIRRFLAGLDTEIRLRGEEQRFQEEEFSTIFFGGGTPSLLSPSKILSILEALSSRFRFSEDLEVTLETNPGTVDRAALESFREAGINRISMGVQSFHEDDLRFLTRIHSSAQAKDCMSNAFASGFENVSLDLMFALPNQTMERWSSNLHQAVALNPSHLSCYSLIVEPNTPLARMVQSKQVTPLSPDVDNELYQFTIRFLAEHGYEQYEVSNFAKPGFKSRHNSLYWDHSNYLGFGPSAHSFWNGVRWWNVANVNAYSEKLEQRHVPVIGEEVLSTDQLMNEEVFLGLRSEGIDVAGFQKKYRKDLLAEHRGKVDQLLASSLATFDGRRLRLTAIGYALCDEICTSFLR